MSIVQFGSLGFSKVSNLFYKAESYSEHQFDLSNSELLNTALHIVALITSSLLNHQFLFCRASDFKLICLFHPTR